MKTAEQLIRETIAVLEADMIDFSALVLKLEAALVALK